MTPILQKSTYKSGVDEKADTQTKKSMEELLKVLDSQTCQKAFQEKDLFTMDQEERTRDELLSEMQQKFFNITRVMDCVACDRCRMNGKVQVRGLSIVLKTLFMPENRKQEILDSLN